MAPSDTPAAAAARPSASASGLDTHDPRLRAAPPNAWTFTGLYFLESLARATLLTVLPLTVYAAFDSKETVSLIYAVVAVAALAISFAIPSLVRRFSRPRIYLLGAVLIGLCAVLMALGAPWALPFAVLARMSGAAMLNVTLSLYIMDNIGKRDLVRSEPLRLGSATLAWTLGPFLGVWLGERVGLWAAALLSLCAVTALLAAFRALRLWNGGAIRPASSRPKPPPHPVAAVRRFARQPRLRLAWAIAFARSSFWMTFFVYVPILIVEGGFGATVAGLSAAAGNLMLVNNLMTRRLTERLGVRRMVGGALVAGGALTFAAAALSVGSPAGAALAMVAASFFNAVLDGLGQIPFLRAVRAHERAPMATVYRTYLDASELLPPIAYFFLFMAFGFPGAFTALAALLAGTGWLALRHLPRRL